MNRILCSMAAAAALLLAGSANPATASAAALCKDGTQYSGASDRGACSHHGGVQQWLNGAAATSPQQQVNNTPAAAPALNPAPQTAASNAAAAPAPANNVAVASNVGGQVWVNLKSKVYHCAGDRYYGKTKKGEFLPEAQAISQGFHADHGKACGRA